MITGEQKMPVEVKGFVELRKALHQFAPDLEKNLNKEVRAIMSPVLRDAKSYLPNEIPGLRSWTSGTKGKRITAKTSGFARRKFPLYNGANARSGVTLTIGNTKRNSKGFVTAYRINNKDAGGAIYETAGRVNPSGQPWVGPYGSSNHKLSHSYNPNAGQHFINSMGRIGQGSQRQSMRGRVIFRAWNENEGRAQAKTVKAIEATIITLSRRIDAASAFRSAA
jgi:hypothetical protein